MNQSFCVLPWIHLHSWTNGDVFPCCYSVSNQNTKLGNLQTQSVQEVLNSSSFRLLRKQMMLDEHAEACEKCKQTEKSGFKSMRQNFNQKYPNHYDIIMNTGADGYIEIENWNLKYWDIRISNLCNMKCRTCGPEFSSKWVDDANEKQALKFPGRKPITVRENFETLLHEIPNFENSIEELYFAGGEPLITQQHWDIIDRLRSAKRYDVKITYQTNMSTLTFKKYSILDVIRDFKDVTVMASIDHYGKAAEIIRHGVSYSTVENNLNELVKHTKPFVSLTVSNQNIMQLDAIIQEFVNNDWFDFYSLNPVFDPKYYSIRSLPNELKKQASGVLKRCYGHSEQLDKELTSLENYMYSANEVHYFANLWKETDRLDLLRNENARQDLFAEFDYKNYVEFVKLEYPVIKTIEQIKKLKNIDKRYIFFYNKDDKGAIPACFNDIVKNAYIKQDRFVMINQAKTDMKFSTLFWSWVYQNKFSREQIVKYTGHWMFADVLLLSSDLINEIDWDYYSNEIKNATNYPVFQHDNDDDNSERVISNSNLGTLIHMILIKEGISPCKFNEAFDE